MSKAYKQEIQRVDGIKKLIIFITDSSHAEFAIKLKYDELSQRKFFEILVESYLKDDQDLMFFINKKIQERLSQRKKKIKSKEMQERQETIKNFGLNEEEIEDIFDIIEKENPDL